MFFDEIKKELNIDDLSKECRLTIIGKNLLIFEGYTKLILAEENEVILMVKNDKFLVKGNKLKIEKINNNMIVISGAFEEIKIEK